MAEDFLGDRRRALENSFFTEQDRILLEKLRAHATVAEQKELLCAASGIRDENALSALIALGIEARTVAALALAPLLEVAWAEGGVSDKERKAILHAAQEHGVAAGSPGEQLLHHWLEEQPRPQLFSAWKEYVAALRENCEPETFAQIRDDILDRAESVAQATGGFLGVASVSAKEKAVLAELERAFAG